MEINTSYSEEKERIFRSLFWQAAYKRKEDDKYVRYHLKSDSLEPDFKKAFDITNIHQGSVLDVGCGLGHLTIGISLLGFQVHGIDISPVATREAMLNADNGGSLHVSDRRPPYI